MSFCGGEVKGKCPESGKRGSRNPRKRNGIRGEGKWSEIEGNFGMRTGGT